MARVIVSAPKTVLFRTQLVVQIGDINYGAHLANDAVLRLCHEVRLRWLKSLAWSELDIGGTGLIMADAAVQYVAQAHHADVLNVVVGVEDIGRSGFTLLYHLIRDSDGQTVARVQTGMVCFDYVAQKVCRMPPELKVVLEAV